MTKAASIVRLASEDISFGSRELYLVAMDFPALHNSPQRA
jgi:hypothetical protein